MKQSINHQFSQKLLKKLERMKCKKTNIPFNFLFPFADCTHNDLHCDYSNHEPSITTSPNTIKSSAYINHENDSYCTMV